MQTRSPRSWAGCSRAIDNFVLNQAPVAAAIFRERTRRCCFSCFVCGPKLSSGNFEKEKYRRTLFGASSQRMVRARKDWRIWGKGATTRRPASVVPGLAFLLPFILFHFVSGQQNDEVPSDHIEPHRSNPWASSTAKVLTALCERCELRGRFDGGQPNLPRRDAITLYRSSISVISELLRISNQSPVRDALPSSLSSFKKIIQLQHAQIELLALRLGGRSRHTPFRTVPTRLIYNPPTPSRSSSWYGGFSGAVLLSARVFCDAAI